MAPYTFWHFPYSFSYFHVNVSNSTANISAASNANNTNLSSTSASASGSATAVSTHSFRQWMARHLTSSHSSTTSTSPPSVVWRDPADVHAFIETASIPAEYHPFALSQELAILALQTCPPIIHPPPSAFTSSSYTAPSTAGSTASSSPTNAYANAASVFSSSLFPAPISPYDSPIALPGSTPMLRSSTTPPPSSGSLLSANYHLQVLAKLLPLIANFYPCPLFFPISSDSALFSAMAAASNSLPNAVQTATTPTSFNIFDWQSGYLFILPAVHLTRFANAVVPAFIIRQIKPFPAISNATPLPVTSTPPVSAATAAAASALPPATPSLSGVHTYSTLGGLDFASPSSSSSAAVAEELNTTVTGGSAVALNTDGSIASSAVSGSAHIAASSADSKSAHSSYAILHSDVLKPMEGLTILSTPLPAVGGTAANQSARGYSRLDDNAFAASTKAGYSMVSDDAFANAGIGFSTTSSTLISSSSSSSAFSNTGFPPHPRNDGLPSAHPTLILSKSATTSSTSRMASAVSGYAALSQDDISKAPLSSYAASVATDNHSVGAIQSNTGIANAATTVLNATNSVLAAKNYKNLRSEDFSNLSSTTFSISSSNSPNGSSGAVNSAGAQSSTSLSSSSLAASSSASSGSVSVSFSNLSEIPHDLQVEKRAFYLSVSRAEAENLLKGHPFHCFIFRPTSESSTSYYVSPATAALDPESTSMCLSNAPAAPANSTQTAGAASGTGVVSAAGVGVSSALVGRKSTSGPSGSVLDVTNFVLSYVSSAEKISHLKVYRFGALGLSQRNDAAHAKYTSIESFIKAVLGPKAKALCAD